ncbi:PH domain-containing protein [Micromonospora aurantiaca (nom. illeg.)]|uniref:PH domain-containing protein n=1 Tax=Micromonospora aurantiaca (nom. illeg.) TaxID=47850 RepID=UPI003F4A059D
MAERVSIDDSGIRVVRPNGTTRLPWAEVASIAVYAAVFPPDDQRTDWMDVTHVSGEFMEINNMTEGFHEAVAAVLSRSGRGPLDLSRLRPTEPAVEIYRADLQSATSTAASKPPARSA